jgi:hypothetical protein
VVQTLRALLPDGGLTQVACAVRGQLNARHSGRRGGEEKKNGVGPSEVLRRAYSEAALFYAPAGRRT